MARGRQDCDCCLNDLNVGGNVHTAGMYSAMVRRQALDLINRGVSLRSVSRSIGVSRPTLREWRDHPEKAHATRSDCPRCGDTTTLPEPRADYAYLLGLYLGDGCISAAGNPAEEGNECPGC